MKLQDIVYSDQLAKELETLTLEAKWNKSDSLSVSGQFVA